MLFIVTDGVVWFVGSSVCLSVRLSVHWCLCHNREPCKNGWTNQDAVWDVEVGGPKEPCIRWGPVQIPHSPMQTAKVQFWRGKWRSTVKYSDSLPWDVRKWLCRSRFSLGCWVEWSKEPCIRWGAHGATWQIWLNCPCGVVMEPYMSNYIDRLFYCTQCIFALDISVTLTCNLSVP